MSHSQNVRFAEVAQIVPAIVPVDLHTGANNGDWVDMEDFDRLTIVVQVDAGTTGDNPVITVEQATDVGGDGAKALNFTHIDQKQGAALTSVGNWTGVDQAAANTYTPVVTTQQGLYLIEFQANQLDVNNGFTCVQVSIPATADSKLGAAWYILREGRYAAAHQASAIV